MSWPVIPVARSALRAGGYTIEGELEVLVLPMTGRPASFR
jgi:hypothetical protein